MGTLTNFSSGSTLFVKVKKENFMQTKEYTKLVLFSQKLWMLTLILTMLFGLKMLSAYLLHVFKCNTVHFFWKIIT